MNNQELKIVILHLVPLSTSAVADILTITVIVHQDYQPALT